MTSQHILPPLMPSCTVHNTDPKENRKAHKSNFSVLEELTTLGRLNGTSPGLSHTHSLTPNLPSPLPWSLCHYSWRIFMHCSPLGRKSNCFQRPSHTTDVLLYPLLYPKTTPPRGLVVPSNVNRLSQSSNPKIPALTVFTINPNTINLRFSKTEGAMLHYCF